MRHNGPFAALICHSFFSAPPHSLRHLTLPMFIALLRFGARRLYDLCQATVADAQTELNEKDRLAKMGGNTAKLSRSVRQKTEQIQGDIGNLTQTLAEMERRYRLRVRLRGAVSIWNRLHWTCVYLIYFEIFLLVPLARTFA